MNHRAKHRKEVKKYLRKKASKEAKGAADERDSKLFLFSAESPLPSMAPEVSTGHAASRRGSSGVAPFARAPALKRSSSDELSEDKPSGASTAGGTSENMATTSDATETLRDVSDWDFDFVFRTSALKDTKDSVDAHGNAYGHGAHDEAVVSTDFYADSSAVSLGPVTCAPTATESELVGTQLQGGVCLGCIRIPDTTSVLTSQHKITSTLHVKYLESVPALPMAHPLPPGTNLNIPTENYMTVDGEHNLHQFSPGFQRDRAVAMRSIFGSAVQEWHDHPPKDDTVIVSHGDAIRSIFQQAYAHDKPMALYVRRVGPTLVIESRSTELTDVDELRAQSLLGKALYRIREGDKPATAGAPSTVTRAAARDGAHTDDIHAPVTRAESAALAASASAAAAAAAAQCGVVALPPVRVGSALVPPRLPSINRFSQTLLWEIDNLEVLVGVDTPIVMDSETRSRTMIKVEDKSVEDDPTELQRDLLDCWFDATLANVPQVGLYVHADGIVQRYEVRDVQKLLGVVDGRIATAAMRFTSSVLHWMVEHCVRDGGTYGVVRYFDTDYFELYELPAGAAASQPLADPTEEAFESDLHTPPSSPRSSHRTSPDAAERATLGLNFARMCLAMGQYTLKQNGGRKKAENVGRLLVRALLIFTRHASDAGVRQELGALAQLLPELARQLVEPITAARRSDPTDEESSGMGPGPSPFPMQVAHAPDDLRAALITCSQFESRLRHAIRESDPAAAGAAASVPRDPAAVSEETMSLVPFLIPCSAALCVVVARTLSLFSVERAHCVKLKRSLANQAAQPGSRRAEQRVAQESLHAQWRVACDAAKDYLQVAAEGLRRLENLAAVINCYCSETSCCDAPSSPCSDAEEDDDAEEGIDADTACDAISALTGAKRELNGCSLSRALAELYGDVVLLCMSDCTPFTVDVLHEIAKRIATREESRHMPPSTTLSWLRDLTPDRLSLSFTALRFYNKAGTNVKRHIKKVAQVYYYVGCKHLYDSRYPKALEALHRSLAMFAAGDTAPCNELLGECFLGAGGVNVGAVERALGDTYSRMATQKARVQIQGLAQALEMRVAAAAQAVLDGSVVAPASTAVPQLTSSQPLAIGFARVLGKAEESDCHKAMEAYQRAGWKTDKARILVHYVASKVGVSCFTGIPLTREASAELFNLLDEAERLDAAMLKTYREQQLMRVFTATEPGHAAEGLVQKVKAIVLNWPTSQSNLRGEATAGAGPVTAMEADSLTSTPPSSPATTAASEPSSPCVYGPLVPCQTWRAATLFKDTTLEDERGLTVAEVVMSPVEKEMQLALACLVMATTTAAAESARERDGAAPPRARPSKCWLHRCLRHVCAVLNLAMPGEAGKKVADPLTALRLRVSAVCWGVIVVRWWVLCMMSMILARLLPVVHAVLKPVSPVPPPASLRLNALCLEDMADASRKGVAPPCPLAACDEAHHQLLAWLKTVEALF